MPNQIPPFTAEGSSNPAERYLHPSTLQQILEALAVGLGGFGGGLQGNPLAGAQLAQGFQGQRQQQASNEFLNQLIGMGTQLGQTPETTTGITGFEQPGAAGISTPEFGETANPRFQDLMNRIMTTVQQGTQLGVDPNQLLGTLQKLGVSETPPERVARIREEGTFKKEEIRQTNLSKYRQELIRVSDDRNKVAEDTNRIRARHVSIIQKKAGGLTEKDLADIRKDGLDRYYKEKAVHDRQINNQYLATTYNMNSPPSFEEWKLGAGVQDFPDEQGFLENWVSSIVPTNATIKPNGGGKKVNPEQSEINTLWKKFQSSGNKWANPKDKQRWDVLRKKGLNPQ
jgi:hypothetical protein